MNEQEVREYVGNLNRDCDDCMEYLNGLENKDGSYNFKDVESYINRG